MTAEDMQTQTRSPGAPRRSPRTHAAPGPSAGRVCGGCLHVVGGLALIAVGVPMLVLPGPGVGAILAGLWLLAKGLGARRPT